jgi:hypothetical protein
MENPYAQLLEHDQAKGTTTTLSKERIEELQALGYIDRD